MCASVCSILIAHRGLNPSFSAKRASCQGLTLVHVRASLEHVRDTFMGQAGSRGAQR